LARGRALVTLASALASGDISLDPGADREEAGAGLLALPGIGPWTAGYIRMRALSDPDVFLPGDVAVVRALRALTAGPANAVRLGANGFGANEPGVGEPDVGGPRSSAEPLSAAEQWRPWRSYAMHHLWATLESAPSRTAGTQDGDIAV
jgi:AraC family transcriptional regulator, regulatory protein of adaptative response / DNA-3-methyladenine glycosylase II